MNSTNDTQQTRPADEQNDAPAEGDTVRVTYEGIYRGEERTIEGEVVTDPFTHRDTPEDALDIRVRGAAGIWTARVQDETLYGLDSATRRHDHRKGSVVSVEVDSEDDAPEDDEHGLDGDTNYCAECGETSDHSTPVNTSHSSTGESGCPHCLSADGFLRIVADVGDERDIGGGYIPSQRRDAENCISVEGVRSALDDGGEEVA